MRSLRVNTRPAVPWRVPQSSAQTPRRGIRSKKGAARLAICFLLLLLAWLALVSLRQHFGSTGSSSWLLGSSRPPSLEACLAGGGAAKRTKLFLFIGIISARNNWARRAAVRAAWADASQVPKQSATRFFVANRGTIETQAAAELQTKDDFVVMKLQQSYQTIGAATLAVFEHVVSHYDFSFVLKTDDDSFVNVPGLVAELRRQCQNPGCTKEGLYMGYQVKDIIVTYGKPEHPHNSDEFYQHTGLTSYPKYMVGGGYIISDDVARMLIVAQQTVGLKQYTVEDATFGYWLSAWNLRHINQTRFRTIADECCFGPPPAPGVANLTLHDWVERDLCSSQPWLVLHKVVDVEQMRYLGQRVRNCTAVAEKQLPAAKKGALLAL